MQLRSVALAAGLALGATFAFACSSSDAPKADTASFAGSCKRLASRCHGVGSALADECHDLGHDGDDATCGPREAECLAACPEGDGHAEHDAAAPADDASAPADDAAADAADAAASACALHCACMTTTCASEPGYPYVDERACLVACEGFDAKTLACVTSSCEKAKAASDPAHECEHASGASACH